MGNQIMRDDDISLFARKHFEIVTFGDVLVRLKRLVRCVFTLWMIVEGLANSYGSRH